MFSGAIFILHRTRNSKSQWTKFSISKEVGDPFYNKFSNRPNSNPKSTRDTIEEYEPGLDEIDPYDKLDDPYFHSDDT